MFRRNRDRVLSESFPFEDDDEEEDGDDDEDDDDDTAE
ncbi:hypothetical protein A2U01_0016526, partial [Trifolium medium]|nr:hypothetical protein [Trifolium medium]